jgi:hypothetical protein
MPGRNTHRCIWARPCCCTGWCPSIGIVGHAFDNALAETTIGLYKHECIRADSPFRRGPLERLSDLEMITSDWRTGTTPAG